MKMLRIFTSLLLALALMLSCSGCIMTKLPEEPEENPPGRYVETNLGRPGGAFPLAVGMVGDELWTLTSTGVYTPQYSGATWGVALDSPTLETARASWTIVSGCFTPEGTALVCTALWGEPDENGSAFAEGHEYIEIDKDGNERTIDITLPEDTWEDSSPYGDLVPTASTMSIAPDGSIFIRTVNGSLHRFDRETGELLNTFTCERFTRGFDSYTIVGDVLVTVSFGGPNSGSALFDYKTGEEVDNDTQLNQFISGKDDDGDNIKRQDEYGAKVLGGNPVMFTSDDVDDEYFYISGHTGIYRHKLYGAMIQQVVSGDLCSLMNPACQVVQMIKTLDNQFYAACSDVGSDGGPSVLQYDFDPELPYFPEKMLKVYSLYDDYDLEQAIAEYQKAHEDVYLIHQVGINFEAKLSSDDAIRNLNADIMKGEGPDIILLDRLPADSYIEKGVLMDLTDIRDEIVEEEDMFENILNTYERDGKICALTTNFSIPVMYAPKDSLDNSTDLTSLVDEIVRLRFENPAAEQDSITGGTSPGRMMGQLYSVCAPAWVKPDGSYDRELISQFLKETKRAWDAESRGRAPEDESQKRFIDGTLGGSVRNGSCLMSLVEVGSGEGIAWVRTTGSEYPDYDYKLIPGQAENVYTPTRSIGIASKTEQVEVAKDFVKGLFKSENMKSDFGANFPANRKTFTDDMNSYGNRGFGPMTSYTEDGEPVEVIPYIKFNSIPQEDISRMTEIIESLDTPETSPDELRMAVVQNGREFFEGEATLDEALDEIMAQVELYLAEKQ